MKKRLFPVALMACTVILSACSKNDGNDTSKSQADKFEDYSMTTEWINYTVAASSELLDDCIALWASWNGPTGIPDEDWERIGRDFFTKNTMVGSNGYAEYMRTAEAGNRAFTSGVDAIRTILVDGMANIANEVGTSKIGTPNALAKQGNTAAAVLQVESWYSWNSIKDYSDNIYQYQKRLCRTSGQYLGRSIREQHFRLRKKCRSGAGHQNHPSHRRYVLRHHEHAIAFPKQPHRKQG